MAAHCHTRPLSPGDHRGCVPTDPAAVLSLDRFVAREVGLILNRDCVDVGSRHFEGDGDVPPARLIQQRQQQVTGARRTLLFNQSLKGFNPFLGFIRIVVRNLTEHAVYDWARDFSLTHLAPHP